MWGCEGGRVRMWGGCEAGVHTCTGRSGRVGRCEGGRVGMWGV